MFDPGVFGVAKELVGIATDLEEQMYQTSVSTFLK